MERILFREAKLLFAETITTAQKLKVYEGKRRSYRLKEWPVFGSDSQSYQKTFSGLLEDKTIPQLVSEIKQRNRDAKFTAIDFMGTGSVFEGIQGVDFNIAITLKDRRSLKKKYQDFNSGRYTIEGNIGLPSTWRKLDLLLEKLGTDCIHLAFARPLGGMESIDNKPLWYYGYLLKNVYRRLSPYGGTFYCETPSRLYGVVPQWVEACRSQDIDMTCAFLMDEDSYFVDLDKRYGLRIKKHIEDDKPFPIMTMDANYRPVAQKTVSEGKIWMFS